MEMDDWIPVIRAALGLSALILLCYGMSERRDRIRWSLVGYGLALQIVLAILILRIPFFHEATRSVSWFFSKLVGFSNSSAAFVFGKLASDETGAFGFAFTVLPTIIFFSALSAILYYLRVLPLIVFGFAWLLNRSMRLSGAESLAAAANVFIGQTEAPLVIKPYLKSMNRSEVMALMTGGMATIAGGVLAVYMNVLGGGSDTETIAFGQHLLTASLLSAPAAMVVSKILRYCGYQIFFQIFFFIYFLMVVSKNTQILQISDIFLDINYINFKFIVFVIILSALFNSISTNLVLSQLNQVAINVEVLARFFIGDIVGSTLFILFAVIALKLLLAQKNRT